MISSRVNYFTVNLIANQGNTVDFLHIARNKGS